MFLAASRHRGRGEGLVFVCRAGNSQSVKHVSWASQVHAYRQVTGSPQRNNLDAFLDAHILVPVVDPPFQLGQFRLDTRETNILPQPQRGNAHDGVETGAEGEGIKGVDEGVVDLLDQQAEVVLGDEGVEDLGIQVGKGRGQVALDHPVALDADDARGPVQLRVERHMGVGMGKAGVRGTPGKLGGGIIVGIVVGMDRAVGSRRDRGASRGGQRDARHGGWLGVGGFDVLVVLGRRGAVTGRGRRRGHGGTGGGWVVVVGGGAALREADAGAVVAGVGRGALDGEGAEHGALAAETLLGERQERILVAGVVGSGGVGIDRQVGIVVVVVARRRWWWWRAWSWGGG